MTRAFSALIRALLVAGALVATAAPAFASLERARAAQARGDLRTAQIELRNAVRAAPQDAALRVTLAQVSLEMGDFDTADREARAAMERGADRALGTALVIRAQLGLNRPREVLREFAAPAAGATGQLAAQILAGRATAFAMLDQMAEAREAAEAAVRAAPDSVEPHLILSALLAQAGDRAGAEAAVDRALQADPAAVAALLRKGGFQFERGDFRATVETLGRAIAIQPNNVLARLQRSEAHLRLGQDTPAREDADAALRQQPANPIGLYLRALIAARAQDWRVADENLSRLGPNLPNIPDALLLQASVKRQLNQGAQALDAAQRHLARRPDDPRGARLLAALEMEQGRPGQAAATLNAVIARSPPDAETYDLLGRAEVAAGRPREAVEAFRRAAELAPRDAGILSRLAAARFALGDIAGMAQAAQASLAADPNVPGARLMSAIAALARGDASLAESELAQADAAQRRSEVARVLEGMIQLLRFDVAASRATLEATIRDNPNSVSARLALARVASIEGRPEEAERLLADALQRDPGNQEAISRLAATAAGQGPHAASSRAALQAVLTAHPRQANLAFAMANVLAARGEVEPAIALLQSEGVRNTPGFSAAALLRISELRAGREEWPAAEEAARTAFAENPQLTAARRQLALLLARRGDRRAAENLLQDGLRSAPGDPLLQGAAVGIVRDASGIDAAITLARQIQQRPGAMPAAAPLIGDLLMAANRPADAATAYAEAARANPSSALALRQVAALSAADRRADAVRVLEAAAQRDPNDAQVQALLGQFALQANQYEVAMRHFRRAAELAPQDAISLNNLAWLMQERADAAGLAEAQGLAERAFFLAPSAEIADTLGWILSRRGQTDRALALLRQAAAGAAAGRSAQSAGISYRFAATLANAGQRQEAVRLLDATLAEVAQFPERAEAERLLASLRGGR
jgi:putative PEP-CTERM system TPR-repeat lipoprotein